jgi:hypothetical protein
MGWLTNPPPTGKPKAGGMTNKVKVRCSKCGSPQYIPPGKGFICSECNTRH